MLVILIKPTINFQTKRDWKKGNGSVNIFISIQAMEQIQSAESLNVKASPSAVVKNVRAKILGRKLWILGVESEGRRTI